MSGSTGREHWFDRLTAPTTRRQGFKALVAGAAGTLPFVRSVPARAVEPGASCTRGCLYSSHRQYNGKLDVCYRVGVLNSSQGVAEYFLFGSLTGAGKAVASTIQQYRCYDQALLEEKARNWDCLQPTCPGFDPAGEYGPCRNCASIPGCQCCPDASSSTGYTYCSSLSGKCCSPSGGCRNCS